MVSRRYCGDRFGHLASQVKNVEVMVADLTCAAGLALVEARIDDSLLKSIDLVVNNAGFGSSGLVHEIEVECCEFSGFATTCCL